MTGVETRTVSPGEAFYRIFSATQVDAIVEALVRQAEFPFELTYVGGDELWRDGEQISRPEAEEIVRNARTMLSQHAEQLIALLPPEALADVVELGPGNSQPVHGLLRCLLSAARFNSYRAIDISSAMLEMARDRLHAAFPDQIERMQLYTGDFTGPELSQVLLPKTGDGPVRLTVMVGNTLYNLAEPDQMLRHIRSASSPGDLLVVVVRIGTLTNRPSFMDHVRVGHPLRPQQRLGLDLLNIDPSWYVSETGFDPARSEIFVRARFTQPIVLAFEGRGTVSFDAGEAVLLFRTLYQEQQALTDQLARAGFAVQLLEFSSDGEIVLVAARADERWHPGTVGNWRGGPFSR